MQVSVFASPRASTLAVQRCKASKRGRHSSICVHFSSKISLGSTDICLLVCFISYPCSAALFMVTWLPIESSAEIISQYAWRLGMKQSLEFVDLFTFDTETAKEFGVPIDLCKGMILLFPLPPSEDAENPICDTCTSCKFIKQTIDNSCCLMALLHILLNSPNDALLSSSPPPFTTELLNCENSLAASEFLENSAELAQLHEEFALKGGQVADANDLVDVPFHFVALIPCENGSSVCLLDGRRGAALKFQIPENSSFFNAACSIVMKEFVEKSQDQTNFAAMILT